MRKWVLASDIDNTLTGDPTALKLLSEKITRQRESGGLELLLSTGRRLNQVIDGFEQENIPQPDAVISQVGTEIYLPPFSSDSSPLQKWDSLLHQNFSREQALQLLENIEGLELQPDMYNTPLKVSCYLDKTPDPEKAAAEIKRRAAAGKDGCQVVWSSGRDLDIIPAAGGKGNAITFLVNYLKLDDSPVVVAGDSGNDSSMFEAYARGIVVANAKPELKAAEKKRGGEQVFFASKSYAAGVEEGLRHFGILNP
ncbi:MAG: HAD-IIB family hydrolase [Lentisphaeria bacterium]